jgi:MOSC domain-containing protein YiiM
VAQVVNLFRAPRRRVALEELGEARVVEAGQRLWVGEVELQVSAVCQPCELMEEIRAGLLKELEGKRGMLSRVLRGGSIRRGDGIELRSESTIGVGLAH